MSPVEARRRIRTFHLEQVARVASKLKELGFTAASDDGVDLPYFAKYRIDKSEFTPDENSK